MKYLVIIPLVCASFTLHAAVFKCSDASGKTVYQASPCQATEKGRELAIKTDPKVEMEAKTKLAVLQMQLAAEKAEQQQEAAEESRQKYRTEQLDALKRNAFAQQHRAIAEQRTADALENRNQLNTSPIMLAPPFVSSMPPSAETTPTQSFSSTLPPAQWSNQETAKHNTTNREPEIQTATHGQQEPHQEHETQQQAIMHVPPVQSGSPPSNHQNPEPQRKDDQKH